MVMQCQNFFWSFRSFSGISGVHSGIDSSQISDCFRSFCSICGVRLKFRSGSQCPQCSQSVSGVSGLSSEFPEFFPEFIQVRLKSWGSRACIGRGMEYTGYAEDCRVVTQCPQCFRSFFRISGVISRIHSSQIKMVG